MVAARKKTAKTTAPAKRKSAAPAKRRSTLEMSAGVVLNLSLDLTAMFKVGQRRGGAWWVMPWGRTYEWQNVGFRMLPGVASDERPYLRVCGTEVVTLASRQASAVPAQLLAHALQGDDYWQKILMISASLSDRERQSIASLHDALGGDPKALDLVTEILTTSSIRKTCESDTGEARAAAISGMLAKIDPTPATKAFTNVIPVLAAGKLPEKLSEVGCWSQALATLVLRQAAGKDPTPAVFDAAWTLICGSPGLDTGYTYPFQLLRATDNSSKGEIVESAAKFLASHAATLPASITTDPLWPVVDALAKTSDESISDVYMKAARALEEDEQPARAFIALQACGFWHAVHTAGFLQEPLVQAKRLAEKSGWEDLAAPLDEMLKL
jgi:hypothetical protein